MDSGLIPFSYDSHSLFFTLLQHPIIFTLHYSLIERYLRNHNYNKMTRGVEGVNVGDLWEMEVDLEEDIALLC